MNIFPFSHNTLMTLNIILSAIHAILSAIILYLVLAKVKLPKFILPSFLVISIVVCIFILLYSIDCQNIKM